MQVTIHFFILDLIAICYCLNCSEHGECLSRGMCEEGFWGETCMIHDLATGNDDNLTIISSNSSIYSETVLVSHLVSELSELINAFLNFGIVSIDLLKAQ